MQESINRTSMLKVGTILRGVYRIDSYLSSGGFGNTYVATNIEFEERVAIKEFFMRGITQRDENQSTVSVSNAENQNSFLEQKEKFKKEARRIRQLKNEHIVAVHDLFEENGTAYYVMDFVDGDNLAELLKRLNCPLSEGVVYKLLPQILNVLKSVHDAGIWHLDLKPANIMVEKNGRVKLIDFGASKQLNTQKGGATTSTAISYTNGYAPREQMEQNYDKFGPWTDIYALGATIYNLLTNNRPPLPTDIDDDMSSDKHLSLPFPEGISANTKELILWMMQTNRRLRPQSVSELQAKMNLTSSSSEYVNNDSCDDEETIIATPQNEETILEDKESRNTSNNIISINNTNNSNEIHESKHKGVKWILSGIIGIAITILIIALINIPQTKVQAPVQDMDSIVEVTDSVEENIGFHYQTAIGDCEYYGYLDYNHKPDDTNGEAFFNDGRYYRGGFSHGVLTGDNAYFKYPNGDEFKGKFRNNSFYEGTYRIADDGSYFVGTFKNGQPYTGKWYDKNGNAIQ